MDRGRVRRRRGMERNGFNHPKIIERARFMKGAQRNVPINILHIPSFVVRRRSGQKVARVSFIETRFLGITSADSALNIIEQ